MEYQVTFTKGRRVGTRSSRTIVVDADTREEAIRLATSMFRREHGLLRGYRFTSTFSDNGFESEES